MRLAVALTFLVVTFCGPAFGQKQDFVWFFGSGVFLDFNTTPPSVSTGGRIASYAASASICSPEGELLFYTHGSRVMDSSFQEMPNGGAFALGTGVIWGTTDVTEGTLVLPWRGNQFIVFSNSASFDRPNVLSFSVIDMSENGGKGDIIGTSTFLADSITDKLNAVRHADGERWWIVTHLASSNTFTTFLLDPSSGVSQSHSQSIGQIHQPWRGRLFRGESSFSPDGERYAIVGYHGIIDLFAFDRCTGTLHNWLVLDSSRFGGNYIQSVEFSPDGSKLYVGEWRNADDTTFLWQFDLSANDIPNSKTLIWKSPNGPNQPFPIIGAMELGPNGKIYVNYSYVVSGVPNGTCLKLSVINNPNQKGLACNFTPEAIDLAPGQGRIGLPNMPNFRLGKQRAQDADAGPDTTICLEGFTNEANGTIPSFGKGAQIGTSDTSNGQCRFDWWPEDGLDDPHAAQPYAAPEQTTSYILTVTDTTMNIDCAVTHDTITVTVQNCKIPNVVTANGDGLNDVFKLKDPPAGTKVTIFDRWGRRIFESSNYVEEWPDEGIPAGVYYYLVEFPGREVEKGTVTVLR